MFGVRSLTRHWSAGLFAAVDHSTYLNMDWSLSLYPAIEYNIFPWEMSHRKIFTLGYYLGWQYVDYHEKTIFDKTAEHLFGQKLKLLVELKQPWGEMDAGIDLSHYFHDLRYYKVEIEFDVSVRLSRFLSLYMENNIDSIHDQLYLPQGGATREDILLKRKRLETGYDIRSQIGIRFTFGSIYNAIVNQRL
jgi:hypothetical protein